MARIKGTAPDQATRDKAMEANPTKRTIDTPQGTYPSICAAGRAYDLAPSIIKYYCNMGEKQRQGLAEVMGKHNIPDYRTWFIRGPERAQNRTRVQTPLGVFETMTLAAQAHGITPGAVCHRIGRKNPGEWRRL